MISVCCQIAFPDFEAVIYVCLNTLTVPQYLKTELHLLLFEQTGHLLSLVAAL